MMQSEDAASFLFGLAKRGRKYYLALTTISQDVGDLLNSPYGLPIITNSSIQLLLRQSPISIDLVQKHSISPTRKSFCFWNRMSGRGFFFAGLKHVAIKIIASYTEQQIITSDPSQVLAIKRAKKEYSERRLETKRPKLSLRQRAKTKHTPCLHRTIPGITEAAGEKDPRRWRARGREASKGNKWKTLFAKAATRTCRQRRQEEMAKERAVVSQLTLAERQARIQAENLARKKAKIVTAGRRKKNVTAPVFGSCLRLRLSQTLSFLAVWSPCLFAEEAARIGGRHRQHNKDHHGYY